jgi:Mn2+/Fe2+ NRAMP family transporter
MKNSAVFNSSFISYIRSMGPGIVVVLTWLGAGDLVESAMAGGNYGYALMWSFVLALFVRYLFVSIISKYQLCNPRGESVIAGLCRVHPLYAPFIFISGLLISHGVGVYLLMGMAEVCVKITGLEEPGLWSFLMSLLAFFSIFQPLYRRTEKVILILAAMLTLSLLGLAAAVRPSPLELAQGVIGFAVPQTIGRFDALFIAVSMLGAVGGGLANLMYPYFIREKGWNKPQHRRLQQYDLIFGILVLIILDLSVWTVGAEILHPRGIHVTNLDSLARLLGESFGLIGMRLFYFGVFAALFSSIVGNGAAYGYLISDSFLLRRAKESGRGRDRDASYRWIAAWVTLSPLPWVIFGQSDFIGFTIAINAAQVVIIPALVFGVWMITSRAGHIGDKYRNNRVENIFIAFMMLLSMCAAYLSMERIIKILIP